MSEENKELQDQEVEAVAEETAEEVVETTEEVTEASEETQTEEIVESSEEVVEETQADDDEDDNDNEDVVEAELDEIEESKKNSKTAILSIIIAAVVVVAAVAVYFLVGRANPYAKDYVDVSGKTVEQIADESGLNFEEFLEMYDLPEDMPKTTSENAAYYNIPAAKYAEMMGMDFASIKEILGWDDTITEETTIGDAFDKTTVGKRVGEDQVEAFKAEYELDDSVTADTLWGEIRNTIDNKLKEQADAEKAEAEKAATEETETEAEEVAEDEVPEEEVEAEAEAETAEKAE